MRLNEIKLNIEKDNVNAKYVQCPCSIILINFKRPGNKKTLIFTCRSSTPLCQISVTYRSFYYSN